MEECLDKPPSFAVDGAGVAEGRGSTGGGTAGTAAAGDDAGDASAHTAKCYLADHEFDEARALPEGYFDESDERGSGA
jgi:peptide/nickel transport system ATP-binding protein